MEQPLEIKKEGVSGVPGRGVEQLLFRVACPSRFAQQLDWTVTGTRERRHLDTFGFRASLGVVLPEQPLPVPIIKLKGLKGVISPHFLRRKNLRCGGSKTSSRSLRHRL